MPAIQVNPLQQQAPTKTRFGTVGGSGVFLFGPPAGTQLQQGVPSMPQGGGEWIGGNPPKVLPVNTQKRPTTPGLTPSSVSGDEWAVGY